MKPDQCVFVLLDVQGKLAELMFERDRLFDNLSHLIRAMQILKVPILWIEQIPEKMGPTIPKLRELLTGLTPIPKTSFSAFGESAFTAALHAANRSTVILAGIETHVCVYQTAMDLLAANYTVEVVADAVSSRTLHNKTAGLDRIARNGAGVMTTEMLLLDLIKTADHPSFREILKIIK